MEIRNLISTASFRARLWTRGVRFGRRIGKTGIHKGVSIKFLFFEGKLLAFNDKTNYYLLMSAECVNTIENNNLKYALIGWEDTSEISNTETEKKLKIFWFTKMEDTGVTYDY